MLAESCIYDPAIEKDLRCICNCIKAPESFFEVLVVISVQSLNPSFNFLPTSRQLSSSFMPATVSLTCLSDIAKYADLLRA
jgi:hypothetical protein